ncbi:MAG: hypothetical protein NTU88_15290 [Armatimonadetes bacterium]|nr:hypothetical protein [Armatimonadota bacterium]
MALREVARLNTREKLNATPFSRGPGKPLAFEHTVWRFVARSNGDDTRLTRRLAYLLGSRVVPYLLNLFSTNNHVVMLELGRIPTPSVSVVDERRLLELGDKAVSIRLDLEQRFASRFGMALPDRDGKAYLPPSRVLSEASLPKVLLGDLELRGDVSLKPGGAGKVGHLLESGLLQVGGEDSFRRAVRLLLEEHADRTWADVRSVVYMPEPAASESFLSGYDAILSEATRLWGSFEDAQRSVDEVVCDWYGFDDQMRAAIREGLPWARRRRA